jgi:hypothetical protein
MIESVGSYVRWNSEATAFLVVYKAGVPGCGPGMTVGEGSLTI